MSVEFSAVCRVQVDLNVVGRATELWLGLILRGSPSVLVNGDERDAEVWIGTAGRIFATVASPGSHEFADSWVLTAELVDRDEATWILAIVMASTAAVLYDGRLLDEATLLVPASAHEMLSLLAAAGPEEPSEVLRRARPLGA
jgi:hypothetical protein